MGPCCGRKASDVGGPLKLLLLEWGSSAVSNCRTIGPRCNLTLLTASGSSSAVERQLIPHPFTVQ